MNFINRGIKKPLNPQNQIPIKKSPETIGEMTDTGILVNFTKLNQKIKECKQQSKQDSDNKQCRIALQELGIEFID